MNLKQSSKWEYDQPNEIYETAKKKTNIRDRETSTAKKIM